MNNKAPSLKVTSHIGRDILQNSAVFHHEKHVIWEYVVNSLQYIDPETIPEVRVSIIGGENARIVITDNGRGMDFPDLENFFVMHGENQDRLKGKPGRGRHGTGKSAAFAIADTLKITTVKAGKRTIVQLSRGDISRIKDGTEVPVQVIEAEVNTDERNGTTVELGDLKTKKLDEKSVFDFLNFHVSLWRQTKPAIVYLNTHECELEEPPTRFERKFFPVDEKMRKTLGNVELIVKVAKGPLPGEFRGIAVLVDGTVHERTLAGLERKDYANYIFGQIDVPILDTDTSSPPAIDLTRSMKLNPNNPIVKCIHAFIGVNVEKVRKEMVAEERKKKESEDAKKLEQEAQKIADIINKDFADYRNMLAKVQAKGKGGIDHTDRATLGENDEDGLTPGGDLPVSVNSDEKIPGSGDGEQTGISDDIPENAPEIKSDLSGLNKGKQVNTKKKQTNRGGFSVKFEDLGDQASRAVYDNDSRTIIINLEHPQLTAALGNDGTDDPIFRRLTYEVAFTEYALGLAYLKDDKNNYLEPYEPIWDIRDTINRIARNAAHLYVP